MDVETRYLFFQKKKGHKQYKIAGKLNYYWKFVGLPSQL